MSTQNAGVLPQNSGSNTVKLKKTYFSKPLLLQSLKANWVLWLVLTLGTALIFIIINLVVGTKPIFTNIDMNKVFLYLKDEDLSFLKVLGLLETMGFSLSRIQVMSQLDLNAILNDIVYKIAGVLLPMIYVIIVGNKLVAAQVSDGSMAYILSTPTNRRKVVRSQFLFLLLSVIAMYLVITACALGSEAIARVIMQAKYPTQAAAKVPLRTVLYCFASFCALFAISGLCFGASCWFNKSKNSLAFGGTICVVSFICCILGLFGSPVFVSVGVGVEAMKFFDYLSLFTLIDTDSLSSFSKYVSGLGGSISYDWTWKLAILVVIGIVFAVLGRAKFIKKDLPL